MNWPNVKYNIFVSYPMLRMTHPPRNFFVLHSCMFVRLRVQSFEISFNKAFQKEKLVNGKESFVNRALSGSTYPG